MINSRILKFPLNNKTDENFLAQPKINLQSSKSTPDSLKQLFNSIWEKPVFGYPRHNLFEEEDCQVSPET